VIYREAALTDAAALSDFAGRIFVASYESQLPRDDLAELARQRFTLERQRDEIDNPNIRTFLAFDPELIGYAQLVADSNPECELAANRPAELRRMYVVAQWHGRGVAPHLLHLAEGEARNRECDVMWLAVWQGNDRAIAFYRKHGFTAIASGPIQVGSLSLAHDFMAKPLSDLS
jgi:ribosomal protein S18 acetylase RimI-like enzyme